MANSSAVGAISPEHLDENGLRLLVRAFYRALLRREPDPHGFEHHVARLRDFGGLQGVERLLASFLSGSEFSDRQKEKYGVLSDTVEPLSNTEKATEVGQIISLGTHCYTSALLKRNGLKHFSGPFDWIFSSPGMVRHCLEDNFATFLDRAYYEPVPVEQRKEAAHGRCEHSFYRERFGVRSLFNHHDAHTVEHHGYFVRCVERFRRSAAANARTLFVQCLRERSNAVREFEATAEVISRVSRGGILNVFVIANDVSGTVMPEMSLLHEVGRHRLYRLVPVSAWRALTFEEQIDEIAIVRALHRYSLRLGTA